MKKHIRSQKDIDMLIILIEALDKQIPKKPKQPIDKNHNVACPTCDAELVYEQAYCEWCGQHIDWLKAEVKE